jgi:CHAD domain-containing protein
MDVTPPDIPLRPEGPSPQSALADRLVQRALLLTSQVLGRVIDEGEFLSPAGVHGVRVAIKRLRAGWRLLAPALPLQAAQAETRLQTLHHALAVDRSRFVRLATLQRECAGSDDPDLRTAFDALSQVPPFAGTGEGLSTRSLAETVGRTFRAESRAWRELGAAAHTADVRPALRRAYRRLREAAHAAHRADPEGWHRWRLRLKRVLYQLELVTGPGDALPPGLHAQWRALADQLGRLQDLEDLRGVLGELRSPTHARAGLRVAEHVRDRQRRLFRKVKAARDEAFALRPRDFVRLLGDDAGGARSGAAEAGGAADGDDGATAAANVQVAGQ